MRSIALANPSYARPMALRFPSFLASCGLIVSACSSAKTPSSETPAVAAPHGKRAPCGSDQACNDDPSVSALWGRCTELGVCECNEDFERNPTTDLCRPAPFE
jgi:hypothetical protein